MKHHIAAMLLATALGAGATLPAAAQTTQWSGSNFIITPLPNCRVAVERAYLAGSGSSAAIHLVFRNRGTQPVSLTTQVTLEGNGQTKSGSFGPFRIVPGGVSDRQTLPPFGGPLAGTTLRVTFQACPPAL